MDGNQIKKLAGMLNADYWKNPEHSVRELLWHYTEGVSAGALPGTNEIIVPIPPDYRDVARKLASAGRALTKEEKQKLRIHPSAKASTALFYHFTEKGLMKYVKELKFASLAVSAIEMSIEKSTDWARSGMKEIRFSPASGSCALCLEKGGIYPIKKAPVPVLDTHMECRCAYSIAP